MNTIRRFLTREGNRKDPSPVKEEPLVQKEDVTPKEEQTPSPPPTAPDDVETLRILIVGAPGVGKKTLLKMFSTYCEHINECSYFTNYNDVTSRIHMQESDFPVHPDACVLVFDGTDEKTMPYVERLFKKIDKIRNPPTMILNAHKLDKGVGHVPPLLARTSLLHYTETSRVQPKCTRHAFETIVECARTHKMQYDLEYRLIRKMYILVDVDPILIFKSILKRKGQESPGPHKRDSVVACLLEFLVDVTISTLLSNLSESTKKALAIHHRVPLDKLRQYLQRVINVVGWTTYLTCLPDKVLYLVLVDFGCNSDVMVDENSIHSKYEVAFSERNPLTVFLNELYILGLADFLDLIPSSVLLLMEEAFVSDPDSQSGSATPDKKSPRRVASPRGITRKSRMTRAEMVETGEYGEEMIPSEKKGVIISLMQVSVEMQEFEILFPYPWSKEAIKTRTAEEVEKSGISESGDLIEQQQTPKTDELQAPQDKPEPVDEDDEDLMDEAIWKEPLHGGVTVTEQLENTNRIEQVEDNNNREEQLENNHPDEQLQNTNSPIANTLLFKIFEQNERLVAGLEAIAKQLDDFTNVQVVNGETQQKLQHENLLRILEAVSNQASLTKVVMEQQSNALKPASPARKELPLHAPSPPKHPELPLHAPSPSPLKQPELPKRVESPVRLPELPSPRVVEEVRTTTVDIWDVREVLKGRLAVDEKPIKSVAVFPPAIQLVGDVQILEREVEKKVQEIEKQVKIAEVEQKQEKKLKRKREALQTEENFAFKYAKIEENQQTKKDSSQDTRRFLSVNTTRRMPIISHSPFNDLRGQGGDILDIVTKMEK